MVNTGYQDDLRFMEAAREQSRKSGKNAKKTGAVIVKDGQVISRSYNTYAQGVTQKRGSPGHGVQHAEVKAINQCNPNDRCGATMYITSPTCTACAIYIIGSGIKEVIYDRSGNKNPKQRQAEKILNGKGVNIVYREIGA